MSAEEEHAPPEATQAEADADLDMLRRILVEKTPDSAESLGAEVAALELSIRGQLSNKLAIYQDAEENREGIVPALDDTDETLLAKQAQAADGNRPPHMLTFDKVSVYISIVRGFLYDTPTEHHVPLLDLLFGEQGKLFVGHLILHLPWFLRGAQQDVGLIFKYLFRERKEHCINFFFEREDLLIVLVTGYAHPDGAHARGSILRQCARQVRLCKWIIKSTYFYNFFEYVQLPIFELASDAFATFNLILVRHKKISAKFLKKNFEKVFENWNDLLLSRNYVTKRQALKVLKDLLLDRAFYKVMMLYVNSKDCLSVVLTGVILAKSAVLRTETYHLLKIFILNPRKSAPVIKLLKKKQAKLLEALQKIKSSPAIEVELAQVIGGVKEIHEAVPVAQ